MNKISSLVFFCSNYKVFFLLNVTLQAHTTGPIQTIINLFKYQQINELG